MELNNRQQKLAIAILKQHESKSIKYYSALYSVSDRTIYNDLDNVSDYLAKLGYTLNRDHTGISVTLTYDLDQETVRKSNVYDLFSASDKRLLQIFDLVALKSETVTYKDLSTTLFISHGSLMNDIDTLRHHLLATPELLVSDSKGTRLDGTQTLIQKSMIRFNDYYLAKIPSMISDDTLIAAFYSYFYGHECYVSVHDVLYEYVLNNLQVIDELYISNVMNALIVLCYQLMQENHIEHQSADITSKIVHDIPQTMSVAQSMLETLSSRLMFNYMDTDITYLTLYLEANKFTAVQETNFEGLIESLITTFSNLIDTDLTDDPLLKENIRNHFEPMVNRLRNNISHPNPFLGQLKRDYFLVFNILWFSVPEIEEELEVSFNSDEIGFLMIYFQLALERRNTRKNILIVCPLGLSASQILSLEVQKILPPLSITHIASSAHIQSLDLSTIDFIISTIKLDITHIPVILVSTLLSNDDKENILNFYDKHFIRSSMRDTHTDVLTLPWISELVNPSRIYLNTTFSKREDALKFMLDSLSAQKIVDDQYTLSVTERERKGPTDLKTGVAIPHGDPSHVYVSGLSILINERKFRWDQEDITIIILIHIKQCDVVHVKAIFKEIYALVNNPDYLGQLRQAQTENDVISILRGDYNV